MTVARSSLSKLCTAMKQVSDGKFEAFENASREFSIRHDQVQSLVVRMENFQRHFASWTGEKQELEREKMKLHLRVVNMERGLDSKSSQIDIQIHKLKDLMRTITLQDERVQKKQKMVEEKAAELALQEQNFRKEKDSGANGYRKLQNDRNALLSLQKELEDRTEKLEAKEQRMLSEEQRLSEMELRLNGEQEKATAGQQRMKELANQLQKRHEEVTVQRQQLDERQQKVDEYETRLRSWEEQLEHVTNLLQGNNGTERHQHEDMDSLYDFER